MVFGRPAHTNPLDIYNSNGQQPPMLGRKLECKHAASPSKTSWFLEIEQVLPEVTTCTIHCLKILTTTYYSTQKSSSGFCCFSMVFRGTSRDPQRATRQMSWVDGVLGCLGRLKTRIHRGFSERSGVWWRHFLGSCWCLRINVVLRIMIKDDQRQSRNVQRYDVRIIECSWIASV